MKALIVNQHSSNFGDDAAGSALVSLLLQHKEISEIDFIYHANQAIPVNDYRVNHNLDIGSFRNVGIGAFVRYYLFEKKFKKEIKNPMLRKWINLIRNADIIFVAPGGANIGVYKDWIYLFRLLMVIGEGKQVTFFYNTVGSSGNFIFDFLAKKVLKKSKMFVREKASVNYLHSLGIACRFGPDTAFALNQQNCEIRSNTVVFIPTFLSDWHPSFVNTNIDDIFQKNTLKHIAGWVIKHGFNIEILPHLCLESETKYNRKIKELLVQYGVNDVVVRNDITDVFGYDNAIASSRMVIGMRYHSVVLAAKNARPFLALCYENKMNEICKYVGLEKYVFDLKDLLNAIDTNLEYMLDEVIINEQEIQEKLSEFVSEEVLHTLDLPICEAICEKNK